MPWKETKVVDVRCEVVRKHLRDRFSVTELAAEYGVSRKTIYKWLKRFEEEGKSGLHDRRRVPRNCPHRMDEEIADLLLEARRSRPTWGPRKILPWLAPRHSELTLPAPSTVGDLYRRHGLVRGRQKRRDPVTSLPVTTVPMTPNHVWTIDYKGQFRTGDRRYCFPLTVVDAFSRYLLRVQALDSTCFQDAQRTLEATFRDNGLPDVILTDNGVPFVSTKSGSLSRMTVWWISLGIRHERIKPGHPEQNGSHERMHRTLKAETARPPTKNRGSQQRRFNRFRDDYNFERPHEALSNKTPRELWTPSLRQFPARIAPPEYPGHYEVRKVYNTSGVLQFAKKRLYLGRALGGEWLGFEEIDENLWAVYYYDTLLLRTRISTDADSP